MLCKLVPPSGLDMGYMLARAYRLEMVCRSASASWVTGCRWPKARVMAWRWGRDSMMVCRLVSPSRLGITYQSVQVFESQAAYGLLRVSATV